MAAPARLTVRWGDVEERCTHIADHWQQQRRAFTGVYGPPRGGCAPAAFVAQLLELPVLDDACGGCLVVDDLIDSGATLQPFADFGYATDALFRKRWSPAHLAPSARDVGDAWITLPWEHNEVPTFDAALRVLQAVGVDTTRAGVPAAVTQLVDLADRLAEQLKGP